MTDAEILLSTYKDCRNEVEMRIKQRDNFATQYIVAIGAILAVSAQCPNYARFLISLLLPLISIYYSLQILYSYAIHDRLHNYIAYTIEPKLRRSVKPECTLRLWERQCDEYALASSQRTPGIRKSFFKHLPYYTIVVALVVFLCLSARGGSMFNLSQVQMLCISLVLVFNVFLVVLWSHLLKKFNRERAVDLLLGAEDRIDRSLWERFAFGGKSSRVVFLDRDGTLHKDAVNTYRIKDLELFDDVIPSLQKLRDLGYSFVIVSNQDGLARELYKERDMHSFNAELVSRLKEEGIHIRAIYYSPHSKEEDHPSFKPNSGMFHKAQRELKIDMSSSYMIGDQNSDMIAAIRAGVKPLFVKTGKYENGFKPIEKFDGVDVPAFENFGAAADWICQPTKQK